MSAERLDLSMAVANESFLECFLNLSENVCVT
jgi:hypothetical protein